MSGMQLSAVAGGVLGGPAGWSRGSAAPSLSSAKARCAPLLASLARLL